MSIKTAQSLSKAVAFIFKLNRQHLDFFFSFTNKQANPKSTFSISTHIKKSGLHLFFTSLKKICC